jgi:hypothetical protein
MKAAKVNGQESEEIEKFIGMQERKSFESQLARC